MSSTGRSVVVSTFAKVVLSTVSARLYSLMYVMAGATTRNVWLHTFALWLPDTKPGSVLNVADESSGHLRTPLASTGQNSYGSMRQI